MYDTTGINTISNCTFYNNSVPKPNLGPYSGGGGVYIEFSYCKPGDDHCSNVSFQTGNNSDSAYHFNNCVFLDNKANTLEKYKSSSSFILPYREIHAAFGRGGGLSVFFKGNATNNTIHVVNCTFKYNHALWGGGLLIEFDDNSICNAVLVASSCFEYNYCDFNDSYGTGGGAIRIATQVYNGSSSELRGNQVTVQNSTFKKNRALNGGALSVQPALQSNTNDRQVARVTIENCTFERNDGRLGSAVHVALFQTIPKGKLPYIAFSNCVFVNNSVVNINDSCYNTGLGAMYVGDVPVEFYSMVHFESNNGSALGVVGTYLDFTECNALFESNRGVDGGAIAILGAAHLLIGESTTMTFHNNSAQHRGGAIFNNYISKDSMKTYVHCFLRYSNPFYGPENWKSTFIFSRNCATLGRSIFSTSILPCAWSVGTGISSNITSIFCWNTQHWNYSGRNCSDEIFTEAQSFNFPSASIKVFPGKVFVLPITVHDDLQHDVTNQTAYSAASANKSKALVDPKFAYIAHRTLNITGIEKKNISLELNTVGERTWHINIAIEILPCPPGTKADSETPNTTCTCSGNYGGNVKCSLDPYNVTLKSGYWIGLQPDQNSNTSSSKLVIAKCPSQYCYSLYQEEFLPLPNTTKDLDPTVCSKQNRTDILCGKCKNGYGPAVNSWNFNIQCVECNNTHVAIQTCYYVFSTFAPTFLSFLIIIIFNVKLTTGPANAFILYAQMTTSAFELKESSLDAFGEPTRQFLSSCRVLYGIFNLDTISYLLDPFCITSTLNSLDVLQLNYIVALFPLVMIAVVVLFLKLKNWCTIKCTWRRLQAQRNRGSRRWRFASSTVHAFVAFVLLSYTKFAISSAYILVLSPLFDENNTQVGPHRVLLAGQFSHNDPYYLTTYALPSILVIVFFVALPPLLLLGPLQWLDRLIVSKCYPIRRYWPADKINILLDTFQGCYKPRMRFFAAVYFMFRIAIFVTLATCENSLQLYTIQQVLCCTVIALLAILQPYRKNFFNYIDTLTFLNLAVLNALNMYIFVESIKDPPEQPKAAFIAQYILIYLPLLYVISYLLWYFVTACGHKIKHFLKRSYLFCCICCHNHPNYIPLMESASGTMHGSVRNTSLLFERAEEGNTYQPSPSLQRAIDAHQNHQGQGTHQSVASNEAINPCNNTQPSNSCAISQNKINSLNAN